MNVEIVGIDGAGKTTMISRLRQLLEIAEIDAEIVDRWGVLEIERYPEYSFLGGSRLQLQECIGQMPAKPRTLFLAWLNSAANVEAKELHHEDVRLFDGGWTKHAATELAMGASSQLISALNENSFKDLTIYLRSTPELALTRKPQGSLLRYECGCVDRPSVAAFLYHQRKVVSILDGWSVERGWIELDAAQSSEHLAISSRDIVVARLRRAHEESGARTSTSSSKD